MKRLAIAGATVVSFALLAGCATTNGSSSPSDGSKLPGGAVPSNQIRLAAVEPDDGTKPVTDFIASAKQSLDIVMYEFDPTVTDITAAIKAAQARGVTVRVLLSRQIFPVGLNNHNVKDRKTLLKMGIDTQLSNPAFSYSHQKSYLIDSGTPAAKILITDFNIGPAYLSFSPDPIDGDPHELGTRGLAVIDSDPRDVAEAAAVFEADWPPYSEWPPYVQPNLVWAPGDPEYVPTGNSITALRSLILAAQGRIDLYVQALAYPSILFDPLLTKAKAGVKIRIIGNDGGINTDAAKQLQAAGVDIVRNPHLATNKNDYLYIHSKTIVTDSGTAGQVAFVGSENPFLDQSLQSERELGVLVTDSHSISEITKVFDTDFARSKPYFAK